MLLYFWQKQKVRRPSLDFLFGKISKTYHRIKSKYHISNVSVHRTSAVFIPIAELTGMYFFILDFILRQWKVQMFDLQVRKKSKLQDYEARSVFGELNI